MLLAQPGRIGPLELKNRVVMAPMGTNYSTTDGLSTERDKLYYAERARGGVGMIMTEAMVVTEHARPHHNSLCCYHDRFIPGLATIVEAIKRHGALVCGQLNHRGALLRRSVLNMEPVGPSPWTNPNTGDAVRPLDRAGDRRDPEALRRLGAPARAGRLRRRRDPRGQRLSLPAVLHAAHQQARPTRYGGSFDNRARLLLETHRPGERRAARLPARSCGCRASEFTEGGYTQEEIVELAQASRSAPASSRSTSPAAATRARSFPSTASSRRRFRAGVSRRTRSRSRKRCRFRCSSPAGSSIRKMPKRCSRAAARISFRVGPRAVYRSALVPESVRQARRADTQVHRLQRVLRAPHAREGRVRACTTR